MREFNLIEVWKVKNQFQRDYTYYLEHHRSYSWIDLVLTSANIFAKVFSVITGERIYSDRTSVIISLEL